jgi:hypothetical protein
MERREYYGWGISAAGVILTLIQLFQGVQQLQQLGGLSQGELVIVFAFETVPFVIISASLIYVGYWLTQQPTYESDLQRIVAWGLGSVLLFASVAALILFSQQVTLNTLEQAQYIAMNLITLGAVVGVLVGIYDAQSRARQRTLERERDRVESFAGKAADINNYGRELNRARTIDEVSALCIQALQTLLGITETAVVAVGDEESSVINSTVVKASDQALIDLATDSLDQEQSSAEVHDVLPDAFDGVANWMLTILVTEHTESTVVLVTLAEDTEAFERDEDVQLLELLVTHAGTALNRIYEGQDSSSGEASSA